MRSFFLVRLSTVACAALALGSIAACTTTRVSPLRDTGVRLDAGGATSCGAGVTSICRGSGSIACNADGSEGTVTDCGTGACVPNLGCRACAPGSGSCQGNDVQQCRADGSGYDTIMTCDPSTGAMCSAALIRCSSPCADAEANNSYIGCEYWPVATLNKVVGFQPPTLLTPDGEDDRHLFHFGVAIANPGTSPASVTITRGGATVATTTVAGGALEVLTFPWDDRLQPAELPTTGPTSDARGGAVPSVMVQGAAYHLTSTLPVTVYQFNALEYTVTGPSGRPVYSYSNDASLLLPTHALTGNYIVIARPTHMLRHTRGAQAFTGESPGFFTLVGVAPSSSVEIQFSSHTVASTDGTVQAFAPGSTGTFTLAQGDVLQITSAAPPTCADISTDSDGQGGLYHYCQVGDDYDLTGTEIRSTGRLELFAGHNCDFVPDNRWACDHLEEGIFPLETWGDSAFVVVTQPLAAEPNVVRIVSGDDNNSLSFDPPSVHAAATLSRGQFIEFESRQPFQVSGTDSISVAQFLVGENYAGIDSTAANGNGDPSESLAIPTEQYRSSYTFLAPDTYRTNFVGVSAPNGVEVDLDGGPVMGFTPVGGTGFGVVNVPITGGVHTITSSSPFGIVVYGFGDYTSYMYPGGLDLQRINVPF